VAQGLRDQDPVGVGSGSLAIDFHRRKRLRQVDAITAEPTGGTGESVDTTPIVNQALASLDDLARDVFLMREVAGLHYQEIAEATNVQLIARERPEAVRTLTSTDLWLVHRQPNGKEETSLMVCARAQTSSMSLENSS
jgi:hypothetical protein